MQVYNMRILIALHYTCSHMHRCAIIEQLTSVALSPLFCPDQGHISGFPGLSLGANF